MALVEEDSAVCRPAREPKDPTGCGGLCVTGSEVCQALGQRAFACHSASQCLDDEWRCLDGLCIPRGKRCDSHNNCYDRSDETDCREYLCIAKEMTDCREYLGPKVEKNL